jgi:predicted nucleic acid-binding protein
MSDRFFVDTNILLYAHDSGTGIKHERARDLMDRLWSLRQGVLSTQVLQEFAISLRRKISPPLSTRETREWITQYMRWEVVVNTSRSVLNALEIEERYQISFWDALIVQAAESAGAETLYTEDLSDGQSYGTVRVVNPLLG